MDVWIRIISNTPDALDSFMTFLHTKRQECLESLIQPGSETNKRGKIELIDEISALVKNSQQRKS